MSNHCIKCDAVWTFEDYMCPVCDSCAVEKNSFLEPTHEYVPMKSHGIRTNFEDCDVVKIKDLKTGKYL